MSASLFSAPEAPPNAEEERKLNNEYHPATGRPGKSGPSKSSSMKTVIVGVVILLVLLLIIGIVPRLRRKAELAAAAVEEQNALPVVSVIHPHRAEATNELVLPANTQAIQETMIYARARGYIRKWYAGMGMEVKQGQLLAEIDSPESEQELQEARQQATEAEQLVAQSRSELAQAQASLEQAEAAHKQARTNLELARVNLERSKTLVAQGIASQQDTDDKQAIFDARQADTEAALASVRARQAAVKAQQAAIDSRQSNLNARKANVQRLVELQSFEKVIAPFDGMITARNVEVGTLIGPTGATPAGTGLYRIARLDIIRIFVNVPQTYVSSMKKGLTAEVTVKEVPHKVFTGDVIGTSNSIDPASRTLMVEARVPNPDRLLMSGMYAQVKFGLSTPNRPLLIPAAALVVTPNGTMIYKLRPDQTVTAQKVEIGRDYGKEIEVLSGIEENDSIVGNPTDSLREGVRVQPRT